MIITVIPFLNEMFVHKKFENLIALSFFGGLFNAVFMLLFLILQKTKSHMDIFRWVIFRKMTIFG